MSLLKEKEQDLIEGAKLSKTSVFLCFQIFQQAMAKASKK
jgi:hypothetical protein